MNTAHPTFSERRAQEAETLAERRRKLVAEARRSPDGPLYGRDVTLADELGGAQALWLFKEIAQAHGLDLGRPKDFEEAKRIFADPDKELQRRAVVVAKDMNLNLDNRSDRALVFTEVDRRWPDVMDLLMNASRRKDGLQPLPARTTFMAPNEPAAPGTPTPGSPWAREGEFNLRLKHLAKEEGLDLRDRQQRLEAIALLVQQFPHLAPAYGFNLDRPTPRNPADRWQANSPDQVVHDSIAGGGMRRK
jgi:hypothetical protein